MRIWLLIGLVIWCGCKKTSDPEMDDDPPARVSMPDEAGALAKANNQFAFELWRKAAATPGNLAISPVSITTALAMAWRGAKGDTAAQMRAVLHFDADASAVAPRWGRLSRALQDPGRPMTLRIANRLFGEAGYPFERAFVDDTRSAFGAAFEPVAFASGADAARIHINDWVEQRTEHRIKDVLGPGALTKNTRLVLVNAIYFLADWAKPFRKESTVDLAGSPLDAATQTDSSARPHVCGQRRQPDRSSLRQEETGLDPTPVDQARGRSFCISDVEQAQAQGLNLGVTRLRMSADIIEGHQAHV